MWTLNWCIRMRGVPRRDRADRHPGMPRFVRYAAPQQLTKLVYDLKRSSCESFAKVKCTASMGLHKIGVVILGHQTRSNSKGMKAWPVRKLRKAWHVGAVSTHDFFKIQKLNRASLESTWFQSESPLASSCVHFVHFESQLTFWKVYQVWMDIFATSCREGLKGGCLLSLSSKNSTFTQSMAG